MRRWLASFRYAGAGIARTLRTQRNMQVHAVSTLAVCIVAMALGLPPADSRILGLCIGLVWAAELVNTAIEATVDLACTESHALARTAKDASAGAVLGMAAISAAILASVLLQRWSLVQADGVVRSLTWGLPALLGLGLLLGHPSSRWAWIGAAVCLVGLGWLAHTGRSPAWSAAAGVLWVTAAAARRAVPCADGVDDSERPAPPRPPR